MGPFGIPWSITIVYILGIIIVPIIVEIMIRSKWWKKQSDFYFSFNKESKDDK